MEIEAEPFNLDALYRNIMLTVDNVWRNGMTKHDIEIWLQNFTGKTASIDEERLLALFLLSHVTYYNEKEVRHLCRFLFRKFLHEAIEVDKEVQLADFNVAYSHLLRGTHFTHLGEVGESGGFVLYLFRQENHLRVNSFCAPDELPLSSTRIVFVDDVTISGRQAQGYIAGVKKNLNPDAKIYLLTFIATPKARTILEREGVEVVSCFDVDERSRCFCDDSILYGNINPDVLRKKCNSLAFRYGRELFDDPLGYDDSQLLISFFYNTPDNTLPIFWSTSMGWNPILKRYHKSQTGIIWDDYGAYI